jgi:hypothetical protein
MRERIVTGATDRRARIMSRAAFEHDEGRAREGDRVG